MVGCALPYPSYASPMPIAAEAFSTRRRCARAEGFDHVVVGADFQAHHTVDFLAACGEENHRHLGETAQAFAQLEAADIGQPHVENGQVEGAVFQQPQGFASEARPLRGETFGLQGIDQRIGNRGFVFDDEYLRHRASCTCWATAADCRGRNHASSGQWRRAGASRPRRGGGLHTHYATSAAATAWMQEVERRPVAHP